MRGLLSAICLTMLVLFAGCGGGGGSSSDDSVDGATVETLSFVAADFNGSTIYEIWEDSAGILGTGGWDGTTLQFAAGGTAAGSEGIADPFVA